MKIIVLMKQVPDTATQVEISADKKRIEVAEVKWTINPYDELALEEALRIRHKFEGGHVTALIVGPDHAAESIRTAYAMGVDDAILIKSHVKDTLCAVDPFTTARMISGALSSREYDVIVAGQRAVDDDSCQVPAHVSKMLSIPMISAVVRQEIENGKITCEQVLDTGALVIEAPLPVLFTTQKGINEPRYPNFRAMMNAKKRPYTTLELKDIGLEMDDVGLGGAKVKIRSLSYPRKRKAGLIIQGHSPRTKAAELVRLLRKASVL